MEKIEGIHYQSGEVIELIIDQGLIAAIHPTVTLTRSDLPDLAPGLVDLQVNGYKGVDFNSPDITIEDIERLTRELLATGVTSYFPTVITNSNESIKNCVQVISQACEVYPLVKEVIAGIHLEGPFISLIEGPLGAHDKQHVKAPDYNLFLDFQSAASNMIKIITLSPEWPEAVAFTERCVRDGVRVSIGHTAAGSEAIREVVEAGASMSTHLGNAAHQLLPRHPNYIWDQLADDLLAATFIGDGFHLPDAVIKVLLKVKGPKAILISDSVALAGLPAGVYQTPVGGNVVLTKEGRLHLASNDKALAGSAQGLHEALTTVINKKFLELADSWDLASVNPAREMNMPQQQGLDVGAPADLVLFSKDLDIRATYKNGIRIFDREGL